MIYKWLNCFFAWLIRLIFGPDGYMVLCSGCGVTRLDQTPDSWLCPKCNIFYPAKDVIMAKVIRQLYKLYEPPHVSKNNRLTNSYIIRQTEDKEES